MWMGGRGSSLSCPTTSAPTRKLARRAPSVVPGGDQPNCACGDNHQYIVIARKASGKPLEHMPATCMVWVGSGGPPHAIADAVPSSGAEMD